VAVAPDAGIMMAVGDGGVVLRSYDAGETWTKSAIPGGSDLRGVASDAGAHLLLAVDASGWVWSSQDTGLQFVHAASALGPLETIAIMADGSHAIAAGARGAVLEWAAGTGWEAASSGTDVDLHAALITGDDGSRHYVAGDTGMLLGSSDWGKSWSRVAVDTDGALFSLDDL
ncbi:MAG: hypothetical protein M3O46_11630, partial [Myxococcota bacterium]|nr:hypothetical protein [Myxococcota bacterium]